MLKKLILITIFFHFHNFVSAANIEEKKSLKVKERFSSNSFIIKDYKASTVILSHGSGGVWKHTYMWKDRLNNQGYNVVIIDHHKEKGIKPYVTYKPGMYGTLEVRFFTDWKAWRSPRIFDYKNPKNIP